MNASEVEFALITCWQLGELCHNNHWICNTVVLQAVKLLVKVLDYQAKKVCAGLRRFCVLDHPGHSWVAQVLS